MPLHRAVQIRQLNDRGGSWQDSCVVGQCTAIAGTHRASGDCQDIVVIPILFGNLRWTESAPGSFVNAAPEFDIPWIVVNSGTGRRVPSVGLLAFLLRPQQMKVSGVVQLAVGVIGGRQHPPYQDQHGAPNALGLDGAMQLLQSAVDEQLVRPARADRDDHGAVRAVVGNQGLLDVAGVARGEVDGERRPRPRECLQGFPVQHVGAAHRGAGQHHGLTDAGQGQLLPQRGRGSGVGRDTRGDVVVDSELDEPADLFADGAVERRITRVHASDALPGPVSLVHARDELVQGHVGRIDHDGFVARVGDHHRRHQRAGVEHRATSFRSGSRST